MKRAFRGLAAATVFLGGSLAAQADSQGGITAHHGKVLETPKAGLPTQGFIEIDNAATVPDTLTGINCPIADRSQIVSRTGTTLPELPVAAGAHLTLDANGPHFLLAATHFPVDHGGAIPCSLTFQNAGDILVYLYATPN